MRKRALGSLVAAALLVVACQGDGWSRLGGGKKGKKNGKDKNDSEENAGDEGGILDRLKAGTLDGAGASAEFAVARTALNRPKLGDRFYVASVFNGVFGPTMAPLVKLLVRDNAVAFGGPCDQLGRLDSNFCGARLSLSQTTIMPNSMATREGLRSRVCEASIQNDEAIIFAVNQIPMASVDTKPGATEIARAYELFYPGDEPTQDVGNALEGIVEQAASGMDSWRYLLLTVCLSPGWQLL